MDCPICHRQNVPPEFSSCPQCDTDLRGLRLLDSLRASAIQSNHRPPVESTQPVSSRPAWTLTTLLGVGMLCAGLVAGRWSLSPAAPTAAKTSDAGISPPTYSTVVVYQDSLLALRQQLAANKELHTNATPGSGFMYVVRRGDTLRGIAWRLYGRVELAEQIGQLNQIADPRRLPVGKRLRLLSI